LRACLRIIMAFILAVSASCCIGRVSAAPASVPADETVGVVMGDSIAAGYPLAGRLIPKRGVFAASYADKPGQPAYELRSLTSYTWYNQAVSGQNTSQIRARWCRDVLDAGCDPGDGLGRDTLPDKPDYVVLSAGINDTWQGIKFETTVNNLTYMLRTAADHDITVIVYTAYWFNLKDKALQARVDRLTEWIVGNVPKLGGFVYRYDEFARSHRADRTKYFLDKLHPNAEGDRLIAEELIEQFPFLLGSL